jgi:hypothetical protein
MPPSIIAITTLPIPILSRISKAEEAALNLSSDNHVWELGVEIQGLPVRYMWVIADEDAVVIVEEERCPDGVAGWHLVCASG